MIAAKIIEQKTAAIEPARVFTIKSLGLPIEWWENTRVKLSRMVKSGQLDKIGRGKYYKPEISMFGKIAPSLNEIIKDLMYDNGKPSGYITGYTIWNRMGLTTQISDTIIIGTSRRRDAMERGRYRIRFITQANRITTNTIPLLQILDAIKLIKQIPDTDINDSVATLKRLIVNLNEQNISKLVKLSKKYPPRVRALLGAILESTGDKKIVHDLKKTLNPSSSYTIGINNLPDIILSNWNIK